ncbi:MAG TPA: TAT-variant-translocated molybdopterin oxidoreductase [Bauldia sp.]|nr:TAT-variant-translocated molybdopterin oxidoreductase [Bauldia sp.]
MSVIDRGHDPRLRAALLGGRSPAFWRSLDELADTPAFRAFVDSEFPRLAGRFAAAPDRRAVLKLLAASLAMGGLTACTKADHILPYVDKPADVVPGKALHYATTLVVGGYGFGAVVESHEGRPTKIEGNPDHPASLGATDAIMQAACLSLYDPERSRLPLRDGQPSDWSAFLAGITTLRAELSARRGAGFALMTGPLTSLTQAWLVEQLRAAYPQMLVCIHDPLAATGADDALASLFGAPTRILPHFDKADVIVSLDDDLLGDGPGKLAHDRAFAARRIVRDGARTMARLYAMESTPTVTGATADHHWAVRASAVPAVAAALAARLGVGGGAPGAAAVPDAALDAIAADLRAAPGRALVTAGAHQPKEVHQLAQAMNAALGAFGTTVDYIASPEYRPAGAVDVVGLAERMGRGEVTTLLMLGVNPAYDAPGDLAFADALRKVPRTIHAGLYVDATAKAARWHVPAAHDLERWGDARAFDGTASIVQPLVRPLYGGHAAEEILSALLGRYNFTPLEIVREFWRTEGGLDDAAWAAAVQKGIVPDTAPPRILFDARPIVPAIAAQPPSGIDVRFVADPWLRGGEFANNAWLQELPRPLSKIVWGNPALLAPATAARLGVATGDVIAVASGNARVTLPVSVEPGHPEEVLTLTLGFGQKDTGAVGKDVGTDVYPLRAASSPWMLADVTVTRTGDRARVITTQHHQSMEGRDIVRSGTLAEYVADPDFAERPETPASDTLYPPWPYREEAWAMVIDQTACIGCMACVSACQAENNIPTVGADEVANGHEMHWLRIDRYYSGAVDRPAVDFQPVPCMQCEDAPCEVVCPVNATVHTHDGLNAQVYNRCVGTRYCSQNCPYKVRRFNFLEYQPYGEGSASPLAALMNPDVSVRSRGVMEKCTYCVQRIERARIDARIADQPIADGAITPACAQACPTQAIVFGDKNNTTSRVSRLKAQPLNYALLDDLNTRPRTTYLARLRNPNPALAQDTKETPNG